MNEEMAVRRARRFARTVLVATGLALGTAHPAAAQQAVTATSGDPGAISRIRALFAEVEREAPTYRRTTRELQGFSLEGGELVGFYRGSELRKLAAHHLGESGEATEAYYFADGRPVFIHVVDSRYDELMSGRVVFRTEDRYYFDGRRLIRHVRSRHPAGEEEEEPEPLDSRIPFLLKTAELFAACAAATSSEPPECTASGHDSGGV